MSKEELITSFVIGIAIILLLLVLEFGIFLSGCSYPEKVEYDRQTMKVRIYLPNDEILTGTADWPIEDEGEITVTIDGKRYTVPACYVEEIGLVKG